MRDNVVRRDDYLQFCSHITETIRSICVRIDYGKTLSASGVYFFNHNANTFVALSLKPVRTPEMACMH